MENRILNKILEVRNGYYVHALEVNDLYELISIIENLVDEFHEYTLDEIVEFFDTMQIYYIGNNEEEEESIYSFNIEEEIKKHF